MDYRLFPADGDVDGVFGRRLPMLGLLASVKRVVAYPAQHAVGVEFAAKGDLTTKQLLEALKKAGLTPST